MVSLWNAKKFTMKRLIVLLLIFAGQAMAQALPSVNLWPQIPFIRGSDLCQYHDAYGRSKSEQMTELTRIVLSLLREGAESKNVVNILNAMDAQVNKQRSIAATSPGMDVLLAASLKASLDFVYRDRNPQNRRLTFFNPTPMNELLRLLRDPANRQAVWDPKVLSQLSGVAWGTYSYAPSCRGDLVITLHIEMTCGQSLNFQALGFPEQVMQNMGIQVFEAFQQTQFPSKIKYGTRDLELLGAPGAPICKAPTPETAQAACKASHSRLPTADEYEYLSGLGQWNGGVCTKSKLWAMAGGMVLAPDLKNPSPVRHANEFPGQDFSFYCVR